MGVNFLKNVIFGHKFVNLPNLYTLFRKKISADKTLGGKFFRRTKFPEAARFSAPSSAKILSDMKQIFDIKSSPPTVIAQRQYHGVQCARS